ncbi:hypothetical protein K490DRAFT_56819 [Saccharata proteae CBS 121410]|uniref:Uncharacterized protein n=1 Tax=Saccharata proteae CBS 121410 TaxID=1314787 RepID=A0A9P4LXJ7_9PEZI|nr:hypothetical protein K490DRAFT_56819 [Saccharata proteae CBS 121410]
MRLSPLVRGRWQAGRQRGLEVESLLLADQCDRRQRRRISSHCARLARAVGGTRARIFHNRQRPSWHRYIHTHEADQTGVCMHFTPHAGCNSFAEQQQQQQQRHSVADCQPISGLSRICAGLSLLAGNELDPGRQHGAIWVRPSARRLWTARTGDKGAGVERGEMVNPPGSAGTISTPFGLSTRLAGSLKLLRTAASGIPWHLKSKPNGVEWRVEWRVEWQAPCPKPLVAAR